MVQVQHGSPAVTILASGRTPATKTAVRKVPLAPGCYVFRDDDDAVLYVGKSVALRQRLASYFLSKSRLERKTRAMMSHACGVEWHTVGSEVEALILESQLIKAHLPPYNVQGREYPRYTFVRLNAGGGLPYLEVCDAVEADGGTYYGPFWGKRSAEQTLEFVNRLFFLRRCSGALPSAAEGRGCFYAQVRRCSAPCLGRITADGYGAAVRSAGELLRGDVAQLIARLEGERDAAAEALRFEQAGELHQTVVTLRALQSKRRHLRSAANTLNFLVVVREGDAGRAEVLAFSAARLRGQVNVSAALAEGDRESLERFVLEHYPARRQLAIDLDELDQMHVVAEWLGRRGRSAVYLPLPDGPLSPSDAVRAVDAIAHTLGE
ncbi:MAG: GIY-YIG nuclease family protein [Chloroflexota bacterium]